MVPKPLVSCDRQCCCTLAVPLYCCCAYYLRFAGCLVPIFGVRRYKPEKNSRDIETDYAQIKHRLGLHIPGSEWHILDFQQVKRSAWGDFSRHCCGTTGIYVLLYYPVTWYIPGKSYQPSVSKSFGYLEVKTSSNMPWCYRCIIDVLFVCYRSLYIWTLFSGFITNQKTIYTKQKKMSIYIETGDTLIKHRLGIYIPGHNGLFWRYNADGTIGRWW